MAEEALRQEQILYEDLVNTQPAGVYRLSVKLHGDWQAEKWRSMMESTYSVDMASDRFCSILGISHEEFVANPGVVPDMIHPDDKPDFNAKNAQAMTSLTHFTWEGRINRYHQTRWVHFEHPEDLATVKSSLVQDKLYNAIRHSLGCQLLDKGFELDKVQKVLGHTRLEMKKRYAKRSNESITQMLIDRRAEIVDFRGHLEVRNKTITEA